MERYNHEKRFIGGVCFVLIHSFGLIERNMPATKVEYIELN